MSRLEKKCFVASAGLHLFLLMLLLFGAAFFIPPDRTVTLPPLKAVPTRLVDQALSGGGGNPNVAPSDAQQRGETLIPKPVQPPVQPRPVQPPPPKPVTPKAEQKHEVKNIEKPKPVKPPKELKEPPKEHVKPVPTPEVKTVKTDQIILKPITRPSVDKAKEKAEAEAKKQAEAANAAAAASAAASKKAAKEFARVAEELRSGFSHGTLVDIPHGPGGEAYADYTQLVKAIYENAWIVTDDLTDEDATAKISVTIEKSGRVISARIQRRSGDSALDKSVQKALDKVSFVAPFPKEANDTQRTFVINFNLKSKRLQG